MGRRVTAGRHPHADLRAGARDQRVRRLGDRRGVDADDRDRRLGPHALGHRARADLADPVEQSRLGAHPLRSAVDVGGTRFVQAVHRDVAVVVVQAGQQPHQDAQRVGHHAAPQPGVQAVVEGGDLDHAVGQPAQRHRQRRDLGGPVVRVGDHDDVGGQLVPVGGQQPAQRRRAGLLLPLDEHRHADRRVAAVRAERRQMRGDTGLVVGAAAAVEPAVAFGGLERVRIPLAGSPSGWTSWWAYSSTVGAPGGAGWRAITAGAPPSVTISTSLETGLGQQVRDRPRAAVHLVATGRVGPHRFDAHQVLEIGRTEGSTACTRSTRSLMHDAGGTSASRRRPPSRRTQSVLRRTIARSDPRAREFASARATTFPGWRPRRRCRPRGSATRGWSPRPGARRCHRSGAPSAGPTCR